MTFRKPPLSWAPYLLLLMNGACGEDDGGLGSDADGSGAAGSTGTATTSSAGAGSPGSGGSASSTNAATGTASSTGTGGGASYPCRNPWFSDDLEWADADEAIAAGPWVSREGDATLSTNYAHSGTRSLRVAYDSDEAQAYLALEIPGGADHLFARWWELRERAGDFSGAQDFDWGGEKFNRFRSASIGVEPDGGLDYPLGWSGLGGFGQPGTQDAGDVGLFGNSVASNGDDHFSVPYPMARGEWHSFELELDLGAMGADDGAGRLFIDGELAAERTEVMLRPQTNATIDVIWIGGWYSNSGIDPEPSPAVRYVDDVVVCASRIGP